MVVWDPTAWTGFPLSAFDAMVLALADDTASDLFLDIEQVIKEGDTNEEMNSFRLAPGCPLALGSNAAYYNHSADDIFGGSVDVVNRIRAKNPSTTTDITLQLYMVDAP